MITYNIAQEPVGLFLVDAAFLKRHENTALPQFGAADYGRQVPLSTPQELIVAPFKAFAPNAKYFWRYHDEETGLDHYSTVVLEGEFVFIKLNFRPDGAEPPTQWILDVTVMGFGDASIADAISATYRQLTSRFDEPSGSVHMLMASNGGYQFMALPQRVTSLFERSNYTAEVLTGFDRISEDLKSLTPKGRIGIFDGPPGSGKTHLLRGLLTTVPDTSFVFVAPRDLTAMTGADILPSLISFKRGKEKRPVTFIVEDADECLAPRGGDNMSSISSVLNLGDGILGQLLDIRLVMTTNAKRQQFDAAITRPGRLSACVTVDRLDVAQANAVFLRLLGTEGRFTKPMTLAEIYQTAFDAGYVPPTTESKIGFHSGNPHNADDRLFNELTRED